MTSKLAEPNMRCTLCGSRMQTKDSRPAPFNRFGPSVRRRRACVGCGQRITTYEVADTTLIEIEAQLTSSMRAVFDAHAALGALIAAYEFPGGIASATEGVDADLGPVPAGE